MKGILSIKRFITFLCYFLLAFSLTGLVFREEKTLLEIFSSSIGTSLVMALLLSLDFGPFKKLRTKSVTESEVTKPKSFGFYARFFIFIFLLMTVLAIFLLLIPYLIIGLFSTLPGGLIKLILKMAATLGVMSLAFAIYMYLGDVIRWRRQLRRNSQL